MLRKASLIFILSSLGLPLGVQALQVNTSTTEKVTTQASLQNELSQLTEEEKLARDVYRHLDKKWGHRTFEHIKASENRHLERMRSILKRRQIADPTSGLKEGQFKSELMKKLFTSLTDKGNISKPEAFKVGVEIEELDIKDLLRISAQIKDPQVKHILSNLTRASRNHLRAFHKALTQTGEKYKPKHLSKEVFNAILASPHERGRHGKGRGHGKNSNM